MYQADVRMRQEEMPRICRRGQAEYDEALAASGSHPFNPEQPWDWVWEQAVNSTAFWRRELEEPCLIVTSKAAPLQSMIDGDVNVQTDRQYPGQQRGLKRSFEGQQQARSALTQVEKVHNVKDGVFESNRCGTPLCPGWQTGTCTESISGSRCAKDWSYAHQCSRCLSSEHGRDQCPSTSDPKPASQPPKGGGKSKGKFKGGGKGKRR